MKICIPIFLLLLTGCGKPEDETRESADSSTTSVEVNILGAWQLFEVNDKGTIISVPTEPSGYFIFSNGVYMHFKKADVDITVKPIPHDDPQSIDIVGKWKLIEIHNNGFTSPAPSEIQMYFTFNQDGSISVSDGKTAKDLQMSYHPPYSASSASLSPAAACTLDKSQDFDHHWPMYHFWRWRK